MKNFSPSVPVGELIAEFEKQPGWKAAYARANLEVTVAIQISQARKRARMTQSELAKAIGTTQSVISRIEQGDQNMTIQTLKKLSRALKKNLVLQLA